MGTHEFFGQLDRAELVADLFGTAQSVTTQYTGAALTSTTTSYVAITGAGGLVFVAPPSGRVMLHMAVVLFCSATNSGALVTPQVRAGGTIGSGTIVVAAADLNCVANYVPNSFETGKDLLLTGLTPGAQYNAQFFGRTGSSGTATHARHRFNAIPLAA